MTVCPCLRLRLRLRPCPHPRLRPRPRPCPRPRPRPRPCPRPHPCPRPRLCLRLSGGLSDSDLFELGNDDTYKPDKGKGEVLCVFSETTAEVGTIAGIVSAVAMALVGAISSYISYQKKKLCFSIQQSLNTDMVKAENPEAVVATEPQAQQTLLEPPNAEPPTEENAV
uniref:CD99 antigen-like protein 2 n=1 Tax=Salarias fasciatus TaxID=181472 RepID=A0A672I4D9_SALFA